MCLKNIISSDEEYANQRADDHKRLMSAQRMKPKTLRDILEEYGQLPNKEKPQSDVN